MSRKTTPTNCFLYLGPCTRSTCSEGEVFALSAEGESQIEEGGEDCWDAGEKSVARLYIFLTIYCKQDEERWADN